MKRIDVLFPVIALLLIFAGCNKEEEISIVGTWQQEKSEVTINPGIPGVEPQTFPNDDPATIIFNSDKTGTLINEDGAEEFTWVLAGDNLTLTQENQTIVMKLTTHTDTRLVGEQTLNLAQLQLLPGYEEYSDVLEMFPNMTAKIILYLVRDEN